jgi:hypothetical protein
MKSGFQNRDCSSINSLYRANSCTWQQTLKLLELDSKQDGGNDDIPKAIRL